MPRRLTEPGSPGHKELIRVRALMDAAHPPARLPEFKAYKDAEVVLALERMFEGKCAYCESPYGRTQPVDIEHWRPKAGVVVPGEKKPLPGYPWLAMAWENLLPSCIDCNRARNQHVLRKDKNGSWVWTQVLLGKANQFPLAEGSERLKHYSDPPTKEAHLLVDPCEDDPAEFFRFNEDGVILPLISSPTTDRERRQCDRAVASIDVYALNRKGLVEERHERIVLLGARFELIRSLISLDATIAASGPQAYDKGLVRAMLSNLIDTEVGYLVEQCGSEKPYALLTNQFVKEFLLTIHRA